MVTLEVALAIPIILAVSILFLWLVNLGAVNASAQDAARAAVRELVRGSDRATAKSVAQRILPAAVVNSSVSSSEASVTVTLQVTGPPPLFESISTRVSAKAVGQMG